MARRNQHSLEEIREMVLDAAETILINEGVSGLTVRKIAMEIGYTVASIYMVFANMADLLTHLKANTLDELTEQLQQVPDCAPEQRIAALAETYLAFAAQHFNRWSLIFVQHAEQPEWYQQKIDLLFSLIETEFARLAPNRSTQQNRQAARALWSGVHGICSLFLPERFDKAGIADANDSIALLVENFLRGWTDSSHPGHRQ